ncbi:MAG TPA: cupredoxin domain-containing protein, partial [Anaerolineales bacterium]|nr:cupredoxin domain-containing protein [Anaerolineales bacterium]
MKKLVYLFPILLTLALSACQSGGPSTKLNVEMTDFAFTPNHFTIPAGKEITVNIAHHGSVVHEFIIMKLGTNAGESFDEDDQPNV